MRTDLVNNVVDEGIYQLQYYKKLCFAQKKINKLLLILFITIIICLITSLFYYYLKF